MANLERTPSNDPKPTQADSLAAFLADWSEDSVFTPMPEAETETDHQTPPRRPSSPHHHPPAAPDLPSGGTLRRRHSSNIVATANNSDDGGTNDDRAINSHATISLQLRRSLSTPSLTMHEQFQMNQDGPSPSCARAVLHKEFSGRSRGGGGGGGDIRPLPFAARPTEQTQQPSSASTSSIVSSSSRLTTSLPLSMDHQQNDGASSVRSYSSGNT